MNLTLQLMFQEVSGVMSYLVLFPYDVTALILQCLEFCLIYLKQCVEKVTE